jgi:quercetin dioxygenase-like cupin family protein
MTQSEPSLPRIASAEQATWQEHPRFKGIFINKLLTSADNDLANVNRVRVPPGGLIGIHTHPTQVETIFVLAGASHLTLGRTSTPFVKGQIVAVPAGLEHSLHNPGETDVELLTVFTPPV